MTRSLLPALLALLALDAAAAQSPRVLTVEPTARPAPAGRAVSHQPADVVLRGLDTLNGRTEDLEARTGETVSFGHLEIAVEACRVPEDDAEGGAHAFLRISDVREDAPRFSGWMFAASPALSALDHPRYDVWVLSCSTR